MFCLLLFRPRSAHCINSMDLSYLRVALQSCASPVARRPRLDPASAGLEHGDVSERLRSVARSLKLASVTGVSLAGTWYPPCTRALSDVLWYTVPWDALHMQRHTGLYVHFLGSRMYTVHVLCHSEPRPASGTIGAKNCLERQA